MPVYAVKCELCGVEDEILVGINDRKTICRKCNAGWTTRIPAVRGSNCANDDTPWVRTVLEVVDRSSTKPHVQEFLKNPTRSNYKAWMKGEGLRPLENGEKSEKFKFNAERHAEKIMEARIKRERYEIRG
jgi:hypothetical protein